MIGTKVVCGTAVTCSPRVKQEDKVKVKGGSLKSNAKDDKQEDKGPRYTRDPEGKLTCRQQDKQWLLSCLPPAVRAVPYI